MLVLASLFSSILGLQSCTNTKSLSSKNLARIYQRDLFKVNADCHVFHVNDSISEIAVRLNSSKLTYSLDNGETVPSSKIKIQYELFASYNDLIPLDSGSIFLSNKLEKNKMQYLITGAEIRCISGRNYYLKLSVFDLKKGSEEIQLIDVNKRNWSNRSCFKVLLANNETQHFGVHSAFNENYKIKHSLEEVERLEVRYYKRDFVLPPPPFAMYNPKSFDYNADSIFLIAKSPDGYFHFTFFKEGFFHFLSDNNQKEGLTLYHFDMHFPKVEIANDLIEPLRFITKQDEFDALLNAENQKKAIDQFWLSISPTPERAREMIREFYNRVKDANEYFTSFVPGWRTDRGIVYVIYGIPDIIYKNDSGESWIYGQEGSYLSVNFNFIKVINPFTDNDFRLNRTPIYKDSWYKAVNAWRDGRINVSK